MGVKLEFDINKTGVAGQSIELSAGQSAGLKIGKTPVTVFVFAKGAAWVNAPGQMFGVTGKVSIKPGGFALYGSEASAHFKGEEGLTGLRVINKVGF